MGRVAAQQTPELAFQYSIDGLSTFCLQGKKELPSAVGPTELGTIGGQLHT